MEGYTGKGELLKARQFRELCRYYKSEKKWLAQLQKQREEEGDTVHLQNKCMYLQRNVEKVDRGLAKMEGLFGRNAGTMIRRTYIDRENMQDMAKEYGIPLRTMQRKMASWLREIDL